MKTFTRHLIIALSLAMPLAGSPALAADAHEHGHAETTALTLDHGRKWATDDPLRLAMGNLRGVVSEALPAAHAGTFTDAQYDGLGARTDRELAYIVENCKLPPEADAALHVILGEVVASAEVVGGKQAGQSRAGGVVGLAQALNRYGEYFDHPGWEDIGIPH
ncbi:hypothetical protein [Castellaniella sp. GW247-6E4]|uniref:hypothetical protein n=1 Tax=Castellaniella sp. GW247-6E4 TaxID=3140380 RepID=UPI003314A075